jgi:hypothetical protein
MAVHDQAHHGPQLAVLIGAPHPIETSMHHDMVAMHQTLRKRGLAASQILCLEGGLDRPLLLGFLQAVHHRIGEWTEGALFLYVTGHGFFTGESEQAASVGVLLRPADEADDVSHVFWAELFQALSVPRGVTLTVLPDH